MTEYAPTPFLGLKRPQVNTGQQWKTQDYIVDNFNAIEAFAVATDGRADQIEKFTVPGAVGTTPAGYLGGVIPRGTTAERNTFYGTPASAAERVALANKAPRWLNSDTGYEEQYFGDDGDSGTAGYKAIFAVPAPGWYPVGGRVPHCMIGKTVAQNTISGDITMTWGTTAAAVTSQTGMYDQAANTKLVAPVRGQYRVRAKIRTNGTLPITAVIMKNGSEYARTRSSDVGAVGAASSVFIDSLIFLSATDFIEVKVTSSGSSSLVNVGEECFFELEYTKPEFVL